MRSGGLFAGYGGLDMAIAEVFGAEPAWFSEIEDAPSKILAHHWPDVPNHGDITKIDWEQVEPVDILSGGFPCQDVSSAGRRAGMHPGNRSGLWNHMAYAISKLRPRYIVAENVRGLLSAEAHSDVEPCPWCLGDRPGEPPLRALGAVLGDLAELGYDAQWCGLRAADVGAPHGRYRVFILARDAQVRGWDGARPEVGGGESTWPARGSGLALAHPASRGADAAQQRRSGKGAIAGGHPAADPGNDGRKGRTESNSRPISGLPAPHGHHLDGCGHAASDTASDRRNEGWPEPAGELGGSDAAERGAGVTADCHTCGCPEWKHDEGGFCAGCGSCTDPELGRSADTSADSAFERRRAARGYDGVRTAGLVTSDIGWGQYGPAIHRWEQVLGRVAPAPTEPNSKGSQRLNPAFVEWMMGLPAGHVTAVPGVNRNAQLKALGNGVVPQQAMVALHHMHAAERREVA